MIQEGMNNLINAIIVQTCNDYRSALSGENVNGKPPEWVIQECEDFFFSDWFSVLTKADPHYIVDNIRKEFNL